MRYLLTITTNPEIWDALSETQRSQVFAAHDRFQAEVVEPGELCSSLALAEPSRTVTVRVRDAAPSVTEGPYVHTKAYLSGYYLVECETLERATELAGAIPDARYTAVEVRPLMHFAGMEM
jgi:hypothetical protein